MTWITKLKINFFKKLTNLKQSNKTNQSAVDFSSVLPSQEIMVEEEKEEILAVETPVALVYNGISHTVMMCSPRDLEDFALGFSLAEGIIDQASDIYGIDVEPTCNGIEVQIELATRCFVRLKDLRRTMAGRTGCGICGSEQLEQVTKILPKLDRTLRLDLNLLDDCLDKLHAAQELGKLTGATHAAAFFTPEGELLAVREDVGRHVALDKLLGRHAKIGKPQGFVLVTSRASYEMVQKTAACGIELLAAISAGTELAVRTAQQADLTLIGFTRQGRATVYSAKERLVF